MPDTILIYFDTSVLDPIAQQESGGRIKALMKKRGALAFASIQNLIEAWRVAEDAHRTRLVRTMIQVCRDREERPLQLAAVKAVAAQMQHHHPDWLRPDPHLQAHHDDEARRRQVWEQVKADAAYVPKGIIRGDRFLQESIDESVDRQRMRRQMKRDGATRTDPDWLKSLMSLHEEPEAFWRREHGIAWWDAVMADARRMSDLRDFFEPYLAKEQLEFESWMRFWLAEVDDAAISITRVEGLVDFYQPERKADRGNWGDINHAGFAVGRDYVLTADMNFHETLVKVRARPHVAMAAPLLVTRNASDMVAEISGKLDW
jgi:hypothetical protein